VDLIIRRRNSLFGHIARLGKDIPAHQALQRQIDISIGRFPGRTWKRPAVAKEASGWMRFALTTTSYLLIYGDVLPEKVILG